MEATWCGLKKILREKEVQMEVAGQEKRSDTKNKKITDNYCASC